MLKAPRQNQTSTGGFTLTELMVAASLGVGLSIVAGQALVDHFSSSERAESLVRQRSHWSRTVQFIEAEVALSERSITDVNNIVIPTACTSGSKPEGWSFDFRVALDIRRDLPLVIYGVSPVEDESAIGSHMLWRCGPGILASGQYDGNNYSSSMVIDGLEDENGFQIVVESDSDTDNNCATDGNTTRKSLNFELALKGLASRTYSNFACIQSRISPVFAFPDTTRLCNAANISKDVFADGVTGDKSSWSSDVVICGEGNNTITGSSHDDVIESASGSSTANGGDGHDRLMGSSGNDTLEGGLGNDTLIGDEGTNTLHGCSADSSNATACQSDGENHFLSGHGSDTITGAGGLDVVFFPGVKNDYTISGGCSSSSCSVSGTNSNSTITNAEILIFTDARIDLD